jgi:hypothetical protein
MSLSDTMLIASGCTRMNSGSPLTFQKNPESPGVPDPWAHSLFPAVPS